MLIFASRQKELIGEGEKEIIFIIIDVKIITSKDIFFFIIIELKNLNFYSLYGKGPVVYKRGLNSHLSVFVCQCILTQLVFPVVKFSGGNGDSMS